MRNFYILFLIVILISQGSPALAQTGPGGVGSSADNAMWYDLNILGLANGAGIQTLTDRSGNGNDLTQNNNSRRPTYATNQLNGKAVMTMDGSNQRFRNTSGFGDLNGTNELSTFLVVEANSGASSGNILNISSNTSTVAYRFMKLGSNFYGNAPTSTGVTNDTYTYQTGYQIHSTTWDGGASEYRQYRNNSLVGSRNNANGNIATNNGFSLGINLNNTGGLFNGEYAEVIVYTTVLNTTQRILVDNYLSSKYSLALGGNDKYGFDGTHGEDVAGIGQESAGDNHTDAQGGSIVRINSADDLEDTEYMLWGHDGAGTGNTTAGVPATYVATTGQMLDQAWRVDISGGDNSVGTVTLTFDMTGINFGTDPGDYELLLDTDNDGDFSNATRISNDDVTANIVEFENVTLADGNFFTIGNSNDVVTCVSLTTNNWQSVIWDCGSPPDSANQVEISDGTTVTIAAGSTESANNLTIREDGGSGGGHLVLGANSTLIIKGTFDIRNGATVSTGAGSRVIFRGVNGNQTVLNTAGDTINFASLEINNTNGVTLFPGDYAISENLDLLNGDLTNNGAMYFRSTAANTAAIGPLLNGSTIDGTGTYAVQRFRSTRNAGWGNITTSGVDTDLEDLNGEVFMSGIAGGNGYAFAQGGGSFQSVQFWNENTDTYEVPASTAEPFELGRGYEIWLADNLLTWDNQAWELSGDLHIDPISIPVSSSGSDWNLLGNPYLGFLNFDNIVAAGGIDGNEYWYIEASTNTYQSVPAGGATIPPGQGFWVSTSGISNIDLDPSIDLISGVSSSTYLKRNSRADQLRIIAQHETEPFGSAVYVRKDANAYVGRDEKDLTPLRIQHPDACELSIIAGEQELMVNYVPTSDDQIEIPITFDAGANGNYAFTFEGTESFEGYTCASIRNDATGEIISINDESKITLGELNNGTRVKYTLVLSKDGVEDCVAPGESNSIDQAGVRIWNNSESVYLDFAFEKSYTADITIYDVVGNVVTNSRQDAGYNRISLPIANEASGVYFVQVSINGQSWTEKILKQ